MDYEQFRKLTWYEWNLRLEGYLEDFEEHREELGIIMAHIANCTAPKKHGNWSREDFVRLSVDSIVSERKPSLKEAKQILGSTWKLPPHGK